MRIGRPSDSTGPLPPGRKPLATPAPSARGDRSASPDGFERSAPDPGDAPFWLVAMATDRLSGRQYLSPVEARAAAKREPAWIIQLMEAARPALEGWAPPAPGPAGLASWQALAERLSQAAGPFFEKPLVVWQPGLRYGRGQFLFRVEGNLLQLKPDDPAAAPAWIETVAHECFHHFQQCLVTALYRGDATIPAELAPLAAYYRDARARYRPWKADVHPREHERQPLEVGAQAFGTLIRVHLTRQSPPKG